MPSKDLGIAGLMGAKSSSHAGLLAPSVCKYIQNSDILYDQLNLIEKYYLASLVVLYTTS
jgi:hypothetical protein